MRFPTLSADHRREPVSRLILMRSAVLLCLCLLAACSPAPAPTPDLSVQSVPSLDASGAATLPAVLPDLASPEPARLLPTGAAGEPIVARVNAVEITEAEFERAVTRFIVQQGAAPADNAALRATVLDTLIEQALIDQAAAARSIVVSDAEIQSEVDANVEIAGGAASWQAWLEANTYTEDEFRATLRAMLVTNRIVDAVTGEAGGTVEQVHARHILVSTEAEANEVLSQLSAGADFGALAAQYSRDVTTREQGGDLGWFAREELLEPYLADVLFSLQPGEMAGPIPTMLGFHVVQTLERAERPVPEDKRAQLAQRQFEIWLSEQLDSATVERFL